MQLGYKPYTKHLYFHIFGVFLGLPLVGQESVHLKEAWPRPPPLDFHPGRIRSISSWEWRQTTTALQEITCIQEMISWSSILVQTETLSMSNKQNLVVSLFLLFRLFLSVTNDVLLISWLWHLKSWRGFFWKKNGYSVWTGIFPRCGHMDGTISDNLCIHELRWKALSRDQ